MYIDTYNSLNYVCVCKLYTLPWSPHEHAAGRIPFLKQTGADFLLAHEVTAAVFSPHLHTLSFLAQFGAALFPMQLGPVPSVPSPQTIKI